MMEAQKNPGNVGGGRELKRGTNLRKSEGGKDWVLWKLKEDPRILNLGLQSISETAA